VKPPGEKQILNADAYQGKPTGEIVEKAPIENWLDNTSESLAREANRVVDAVGLFLTKPLIPESQSTVLGEKLAQQRAAEEQAAQAENAAQQKIIAENTEKLRKEQGLPAPVAVRNEVAANAGVKPVMPDQVAAAPAAAPQVAATKPTRINSLTGLPMGYRPGDAVAAPQQKAADESVNNQRTTEAFGGIEARPADIAAANGAMRSQGMVVRAPTAASMPRGPASQPVAAGPTKRADGYVARSPIEDTRMQMASERAARERVPTAANPPGLKLVGPKRPLDELVRRSTPPRAIPVG
jgi:hypothetical protein